MTQEEKELVKKDICESLHYGIFILVHDTFPGSVMPYENVFLKVTNVSDLIDNISLNERYCSKDLFNKIIKQHKDYLEFYPYLRSLSSMTEEEKKELSKKYNWRIGNGQIQIRYHSQGCWDDETECPTEEYIILFDWLNTHHFDYHGLIEKGLAVEVTEENNPYED
jgi:hypothetical protein